MWYENKLTKLLPNINQNYQILERRSRRVYHPYFDKYMHIKSHSLKRLFRLFSAGDNFKQFLTTGIWKLKKDQLFNIGFNLLVFALLRASLYRIKNIVCLKDRRLNHILSAYCKK